MRKIVECVPNFSEGRDERKINLVVLAIQKVKGVKILNVDVNPDYNRTVISFAGGPREVKEASFAAIAKACELIDMSYHKGEHPRLGACDVCPFIPIRNCTMEECVMLAKEVGEMVGASLKIPVYFYEEAAIRPERKNLADVRRGEYEGLEEKLKDPKWQPDCGLAIFHKRNGALIIGARKPLIAYNVNLETKEKKIADQIARVVRESNGGLRAVKAIGVFLKERGICQISMNLTDYKITPPSIVFEAIKMVSPVKILGSEVVGLIPLEAILIAGRFYQPEVKSEKELIAAAVKNLKLEHFEEVKIIEYAVG